LFTGDLGASQLARPQARPYRRKRSYVSDETDEETDRVAD
jgi:hypothetical protein